MKSQWKFLISISTSERAPEADFGKISAGSSLRITSDTRRS